MSGKKGSKWNCGLMRMIKEQLQCHHEAIVSASAVVGKLDTFIKYCNSEDILLITKSKLDPLRQSYYARKADSGYKVKRTYGELPVRTKPLTEGEPYNLSEEMSLSYTEEFILIQ